jgi:hypothetical protein
MLRVDSTAKVDLFRVSEPAQKDTNGLLRCAVPWQSIYVPTGVIEKPPVEPSIC